MRIDKKTVQRLSLGLKEEEDQVSSLKENTGERIRILLMES